MNAYRAFGLRIHSALPLPFDDLPAEPACSADPDVVVRLVSRSEGQAGVGASVATRDTPTHYWKAQDGELLLHVHGVARYLVRDGRDVSIVPLGGTDQDVVTFLLSSPLAVLLMQRGVVPLHASSVKIGAEAVLLVGPSGIGKSTLAAALTERGHPLVADDLTGVALGPDGVPLALPAYSRLRLWREALERLDLKHRAGPPVREDLEKHWVQADRYWSTRLPVRAVFMLQTHSRSNIAVEPMSPSEAFWELPHHVLNGRAVEPMGRRSGFFPTIARLAGCVPTVRLARPTWQFRVREMAERVAALARESRTGPRRRDRTAAVGQPRAASSGRGRPMVAPPRQADTAQAIDSSSPGFVWLASYPKSGNTWLRAVLTNFLQDDGQPASINALEGKRRNLRHTFDNHFGVRSADMTDEEVARYMPQFYEFLVEQLVAEGRSDLLFLKTHSAYRVADGAPLFPKRGTNGVVYLVRNPLDVAVSFARHMGVSIDQAIRTMAYPATADMGFADGIRPRLPEPLTTWSGHVSSWTEQTDLPIHVARYEDLVQNPQTGFGAIIRFAGVELDRARVERAVEHSAFPVLRAQEERHGFREKYETGSLFFRAGTAGSWRTVLTPTQARTILRTHGEMMARYGYLWEAEVFLAS